MGERIIAYDIHTPKANDNKEKEIESEKRKRMDAYLKLQEATFINKSTYLFRSDKSSDELYEEIWHSVFDPERDEDDLFIAEICNDNAFTTSKRFWKRAGELAQIKK